MITQTTLRIEKELHKQAKKRAIDLDISFMDYVIYLIEKDLKKGEK